MDYERQMHTKTTIIESTNIIQHFINAPDLKIYSEKYPFEYFDFQEELIKEINFQIPKNSVIGMQAEACFKAYLKHSRHYELLASNLQITDEKETIGELDYILRNLKTSKVVHIELACKFYLYDISVGTTEEEKWVGPNRKDSLLDKLEKIKSKQFPLITAPETHEKLKSLEIEIPSSQKLCLKAFLFVPKDIIPNRFSNNYRDCIVGYWIKLTEFENEDVDSLYALPEKKEWLFPAESIKFWNTFDEIKLEIYKQHHLHKSPLIFKKTPEKTERFFVVWW